MCRSSIANNLPRHSAWPRQSFLRLSVEEYNSQSFFAFSYQASEPITNIQSISAKHCCHYLKGLPALALWRLRPLSHTLPPPPRHHAQIQFVPFVAAIVCIGPLVRRQKLFYFFQDNATRNFTFVCFLFLFFFNQIVIATCKAFSCRFY